MHRNIVSLNKRSVDNVSNPHYFWLKNVTCKRSGRQINDEIFDDFDSLNCKQKMKQKIRLSIISAIISVSSFAQTNIIDSLVHQTYQRKYTVHTPTGFTNTTPVSLVLMLHGGGGTMANAQGFTNLNSVSNTNGFLVVYPQGYGIIISGGFSWADGRGTSADIAGIDDLGFINKLLDTLIANYTIDTNKIYICGFSNGGFMTQRFACQLNQRYAAMASLGSIMDTTLFASCNPTRPIPMLFMLGTSDPFVPCNGGPMIGSGSVTPIVGMDTLLNFWKTNNNCLASISPINLPDIDPTDTSTVTVFSFTNCSCNSDILFYRINGGGHTWPGVEIPSYEIVAGQTNEDIQASVELWNFFKAHTLCNTTVGINERSIRPLIKIYPNPAKTELTLGIPQNDKNEVLISNLFGQVVVRTQNQNRIDISNLTSGIYIVTITQGQNEYTQKFIKE
jgi:polyhydroxybutyrate depolymerase